jgi:hypothetical protein
MLRGGLGGLRAPPCSHCPFPVTPLTLFVGSVSSNRYNFLLG